MIRIAAVALLLLLAVSLDSTSVHRKKHVKCNSTAYPPDPDTELPWYNVSLDTPARDRWTPLVSQYKGHIQKMVGQIVHLVRFIDIDHWIVDIINEEGPKILQGAPQDFIDEIEGVAAASEMPLGEIVLLNIFYEVFSACTSIVTETSEGTHIHGRNLDFGLFLGWDFTNHTWAMSETLRGMIVNLNMTRDGETVYKQTTIVGFVGILTAVKPGLSISINERFILNGGYAGLIEWIRGDHDQAWTTWLPRQLMDSDTSFDAAVSALQGTRLLSPVYYIVSGTGPDQGAIITRSRGKNDDSYFLSSPDRWYILETNYDRWKSPFFLDNRRYPAQKCMNESSVTSVTPGSVYNVLSTSPVLNRLTVYTTLMDPHSGTLRSYRQNCPSCYIW